MKRAVTFVIGAAAVVALSGTAFSDGDPSNFNPVGNSQPFGECFFESFDFVTPPLLPVGWTAINTIDPDGIFWQTSNSGEPSPPAFSPPNAAWVNDPDTISDKSLYWELIVPDKALALIFNNNYAMEEGFDGGVLEISVASGPFQDILEAGGLFLTGGYNGTISTCCGNPLAGRQAWTGNTGGIFIQTNVDMPAFKGLPIVLRWRMASDSKGSGDGWRIDDAGFFCKASSPTPTIPPPTPTPTPTPRPVPTPRLRPTPLPRPTPR